ncbi:PREDICTED: uncharacterized protein LOC106750871, partial [Dinoponera quadriceps]|uniref:Uncharacterized protein LOC106750871 n=1 Tax=Dinoponera quadriceps TaxID=609295 RepID=A0A6P3YAH8_DINQU
FLEDKDSSLKENLLKSETDIAYLIDLFGKFNDVNLQLQGDNLNLIKAKLVISAFVARLIAEPNLILQDELLIISTNEDLKVQFKQGYQKFWLQQDIPLLNPALWTVVQKYLLAFPSSYLVERGFNVVLNLLQNRHRLLITEHGDLRTQLTNLKSNIDKLLTDHQVHPSH